MFSILRRYLRHTWTEEPLANQKRGYSRTRSSISSMFARQT
jgi:hypothetical protein